MKPAPLASRLRSLARVVAVSATISLPSHAFACGYHLEGVLAQRVELNIVYPDAMHVLGAISTAQIEKRLPISAYVSAPHMAMIPPAIHAPKKTAELGDEAATFAGVRKMPIPITSVTMIIVKSNRFNFGLTMC